MTIFQFVIIRSLRKKSLLTAMCLVPLAMTFIRPMWSLESGNGFNFYGMVIMLCAFLLSQFIMNDRVTGTAIRIFVAPVTTFQYLYQNLLAFWLVLSVQITMVVTIVVTLYEWSSKTMAYLILLYVVFAINCIAFSLAWNSMFRSKIMSTGIFSVIISFMGILGGVFIPTYMLPDSLRLIGMLFPTYWLSNSLGFVLTQDIVGEFWLSVCVMILSTIAFLLYGSKRRLE